MKALLRLLSLSLCLATMLLALAGPARAGDEVQVQVLDPTPGATVVRCVLGDYDARPVDVLGAAALELSLPGEGYLDVVGAPRLPRVCRSVVLPGDRDVRVRVLSARFHDVPGVAVAPARGPIPRTQDPASVPYVRGPAYTSDAFWPGELVTLREPYLIRDVRGTVVEVNALQANPVSGVLRVYDEIVFRLESAGPASVNAAPAAGAIDRSDREFERLYRNHFINWVPQKAIQFGESGDMLIISHGPFMSDMAPFVAWKNAQGIATTIVDVAAVGNNFTAIKSYIQSAYNTSNLSYVLLVGDIGEIASGSYAGGLSDPSYSTLTADWYPDILVGRFSAQTSAQVQTQVERSIEYEQMDHSVAAGGWNAMAMGIASNQGPGHYGEYDNQHMDLIRQDLLGYGFTLVDQIYDPFGTKAMIANGLNAGRRLVNYCGHGSTTSWGTTGFSNTDINNLVNDNLLPVIHSVACVNGAFASTCFGETWLRATHNGEPTGAAGAYMSSINQYWNEPMYAQDETIDLLCAETFWGMGALWFAGSCKMMELQGSSGRDMFMTWICFGDPSLRILGDATCDPPTSYCTPSVNSTGKPALIGSRGTTSIAAADFALEVQQAVPGQNGIFFYGGGQAALPFGEGTLCVSAGGKGIFRLLPVQSVDPNGYAQLLLDYANPPVPAALITAGSTWYFQFWYRDPSGGPAGFNLSDGLAAQFCP